MKRNEWKVNYTGAKLAAAAQSKSEYHAGRAKLWQEKKEDTMSEIRSSGMEINESIAEQLRQGGQYTTSNAGYGPTVSIRADLLAKLQEAHGKVGTHDALVKQYDAWNQMLSAHDEASFELQQDDWMFFFGK